MKQNAQQIRIKLLTVIMAGVAGAGFATAAMAAGGGGAKVGAGAQVVAPDNAQAGGYADAHMNATGSASSNAQWQHGATRGADRAAERMGTDSDGQAQSTAVDLDAVKATAKAKRPDPR